MGSILKELPISATFQMANTKSRARKILWIVLFFSSIMLAIYQTVAMTLAYFKFSVTETATTDVNFESPIITICVNSPVSNRLGTYTDLNSDQLAILDKVSNLSSECNTTIPSLFCLSLLTAEERYKTGYNPLFRLPPGFFFRDTMARSLYTIYFNNLYYGNCATVGTTNISYILRSYASVAENHLRPMIPPFSIAVIHGEDFSPVFTPENIISSSTNAQNMIYVTKSEYRRKPWPYESLCIDEQTHPTKSWIITHYTDNYNVKKPKYSRAFCLDQCLHNLTAKYCKCILPKSLLNINVDRLPICTNRCGKIPEDELKEMCNCQMECKSTHYKIDQCLTYPMESDDLLMSYWKNYMRVLTPNVENYKLGQFDHDSYPRFYLARAQHKIAYTRFIVLTSRVVEVVTETAELELEAWLSNIGGIWGLWIGISILTLLEVISKLIKGNCNSKFCQSYKFKIKLSKFIWTFIKLLSATMATWQAYITLKDYFEYNVIRVSTTVSQEQPVFPSVTVCSNTFIYYKDEEQLPMNSTTRLLFARWKNLTISDEKFPKQHSTFINDFLTKTSESDLNLLAPRVQDFVTSCEYETDNGNHYNCMNKLVEFHIKYPEGMKKTCAHLNAKLLLSNSSANIFPKDLFIKLESLFNDLMAPWWSVLDISIHSPGTAPFVNPNEHVVITPGDYVDVKFSTFQRLPHPYTSDCIDEESDSAVWLSNFYDANDHLSYRYTIESCLQSCIMNATFNILNCRILTTMDDHIMREALSIMHVRKSHDIFTKGVCVDDAPILQDIFGNHTMCRCRPSCRNVLYELNMKRMPLAYKKKTNFDEYDHIYTLVKHLNTGPSGIRIRPASHEIQMVTEVPKIESFSLVGLIGGVFGLWIGISIISFAESVYSIAATFMTKIYKKKTTKKISD